MHAARSPPSIQGQLLRVSEHRAVAIYLREGTTWVADFVDGPRDPARHAAVNISSRAAADRKELFDARRARFQGDDAILEGV